MKCLKCGFQIANQEKTCKTCETKLKRGAADYIFIVFSLILIVVMAMMTTIYMGRIQIMLLIAMVLVCPIISVLLLRKVFQDTGKILITRIIIFLFVFVSIIVASYFGKIRYSKQEAVDYAVKQVALERNIDSAYHMDITNYTIEEKEEDNHFSLVTIVLDYNLTNQNTNEVVRDVATIYAYYNWSTGEFCEDKYGKEK